MFINSRIEILQCPAKNWRDLRRWTAWYRGMPDIAAIWQENHQGQIYYRSIALNIATYVNRVITAMQVLFCFFNKMHGITKCKGRYLKRIKCVREKPLNKYNKYIKENISTRVSNYMYSWNVNKSINQVIVKKKIW